MISQSVLFALLSLTFAGINDVVFKQYGRQDRSRGMLIFGIGVVWTLLQYAEIQLSGQSLVLDSTTSLFGLVAGIFVAVANILLLEGLRHLDISLGSTIYRLNTVGVVLLSLVFLGESMTLVKVGGIGLGIMAVLLLYHHGGDVSRRTTMRLGLGIIIAASLTRSLYGVISKAGLEAGADSDGLIMISAVCWVVSGFLYAVFVERRPAVTRDNVGYALVSGCLVRSGPRILDTPLSEILMHVQAAKTGAA